MTVEEWLAAYAESLGVPAPDAQAIDILLEIAASAAHASERIAAPVACYLVGLAGSDLAAAREAAAAVEGGAR